MSVVEAGPAGRHDLRSDRGHRLTLHVGRWFDEPSAAELAVLDRATAPVLDLGCGPARHTLALLGRGVSALGVDVSAAAVRLARGRGAPVLHRSLFDRLPDEGAWGSALLLDGNVGIGGSPALLLRRTRELLATDGMAIVELDRPGAPTFRTRIRIEAPDVVSEWFAWARVGVDGIGPLARRAGLAHEDTLTSGGRWIALLRRT
jgi:SAM-dependent methyltransferase